MKKILVIFLVIFVTMFSVNADEGDHNSNNKSGIFIDFDAGLVFIQSSGSSSINLEDYSRSVRSVAISGIGNYGLRLGYQAVGSHNGLRFYGHINYSDFYLGGFDNHKSISMLRYGVNIDYLLNFSDKPSTWGIFLGGGYEWVGGTFGKYIKNLSNSSELINIKKSLNGFLINTGFAKTFSNKHRFEFGVKIPFYTLYTGKYNIDTIANGKSNLDIIGTAYISYGYTF